MVSAFLASMCGALFSAQARMCTVTSYELVRPYASRIESHINELPLVEQIGQNYLANGLAVGYNLGFRQQIDFGQRINYIQADSQITLGRRYVGLQLRWEY
jgi:hypothetical protein